MLSGYSFYYRIATTLLKKFVFLIWQIYAEMIGNVMIDARSTGKYYHCKYINIQVKYYNVVIHHVIRLYHQGNPFCYCLKRWFIPWL